MQCSREFTPSDLSTGISKLLQPAQAEVVLGQLSMYLSSWVETPVASYIMNSMFGGDIEFIILLMEDTLVDNGQMCWHMDSQINGQMDKQRVGGGQAEDTQTESPFND